MSDSPEFPASKDAEANNDFEQIMLMWESALIAELIDGGTESKLAAEAAREGMFQAYQLMVSQYGEETCRRVLGVRYKRLM
jgi:hypothetical protein